MDALSLTQEKYNKFAQVQKYTNPKIQLRTRLF